MTTPLLVAASPDDLPPRGIASTIPCPVWCDGNCDNWTDNGDADRYHSSGFTTIKAVEQVTGQSGIDVSTTRLDTPAGPGEAQVHLLTGTDRVANDDWALTPTDARQLAAALLNAADLADAPPNGELSTLAQHIRIGDDLLTPDGWQSVYMTMIDGHSLTAAAFTAERNDTDTDGWQYTFGDRVRVRRAVTR